MKKKGPRVNQRITSSMVRLVDENAVMIGVVSIDQAIEQAKAANLDLVEVNPNSSPPVCKILDYGRMKYDLKKKSHQSKKKQNIVVLKEVKIRPNIGQHDYSVKMKNIRGFLEDKHKVKITLKFRGREIMYQNNGMEILTNIIEDTKDIAALESQLSKTDNQLTMVLVAK